MCAGTLIHTNFLYCARAIVVKTLLWGDAVTKRGDCRLHRLEPSYLSRSLSVLLLFALCSTTVPVEHSPGDHAVPVGVRRPSQGSSALRTLGAEVENTELHKWHAAVHIQACSHIYAPCFVPQQRSVRLALLNDHDIRVPSKVSIWM